MYIFSVVDLTLQKYQDRQTFVNFNVYNYNGLLKVNVIVHQDDCVK